MPLGRSLVATLSWFFSAVVVTFGILFLLVASGMVASASASSVICARTALAGVLVVALLAFRRRREAGFNARAFVFRWGILLGGVGGSAVTFVLVLLAAGTHRVTIGTLMYTLANFRLFAPPFAFMASRMSLWRR